MGTAGRRHQHLPWHEKPCRAATDLGVLADYAAGLLRFLSAGALAPLARVWEKDLEWLQIPFSPASFNDTSMMNLTGIPVSRLD